jgi:hypothetical protein
MRFFINSKNCIPGAFRVIMSRFAEDRLAPLSFLGEEMVVAGNFRKWITPLELLKDPEVLAHFTDYLEELSNTGKSGPCRLMIHCKDVVGWSSTDRIEKYNPEDLIPFKPNNRSEGMKVCPHHDHLLAPATQTITIIFEFKTDPTNPDEHLVVVHSMYPGEDIGALDGNITADRGYVFFEWRHPGEQVLVACS